MTDDEIDQLRHDTANTAQKLCAARAMALRALAAIELKDETEAKRILRNLLSGLENTDD